MLAVRERAGEGGKERDRLNRLSKCLGIDDKQTDRRPVTDPSVSVCKLVMFGRIPKTPRVLQRGGYTYPPYVLGVIECIHTALVHSHVDARWWAI